MHIASFSRPNDDPTDTMMGNTTVDYVIDNQDRIALYNTGSQMFKESTTDGKQLLHADLNHITEKQVRQTINSIVAEAESLGYKHTGPTTRKEREEHLVKSGTVAPVFGGRTVLGDSISVSDIHSKLLLLDFWYAGCGPCRYALPFLRTLQSKYSSKGLTVVGMNPMDDDMSVVQHVIDLENLQNPEIMISRHVSDELFGVESYPTFLLLDKDRKIIYSKIGYAKQVEAEIESAIIRALE